MKEIIGMLIVGITHCLLGARPHSTLGWDVAFRLFITNRPLDRLPVILGCFHRFLFIFRLFVGILPVLFS